MLRKTLFLSYNHCSHSFKRLYRKATDIFSAGIGFEKTSRDLDSGGFQSTTCGRHAKLRRRLVTTDKDNNWVPCLAKDWRWIDDKTIEFKLREDIRFHNGEKFNAEVYFVPQKF